MSRMWIMIVDWAVRIMHCGKNILPLDKNSYRLPNLFYAVLSFFMSMGMDTYHYEARIRYKTFHNNSFV